MSRLPFTTAESAPGRDEPITVSMLAASVKAALAAGLPRRVVVLGEVSNFTDRSHWFFSLKDEQATIRCVCFASSAKRMKVKLADGMAVVATGRIDFYDASGSVQLYVDHIEPAGVGDLQRQLQALMAELRERGYFDADRKKELPPVPRKIAVITSRTAAALQDVIHTTLQRWAGCQLLLYDVRVQGELAAGQIAEAIDAISQSASGQPTFTKRGLRGGTSGGIDAILLTRGGGGD